jgi:hypothetical protein
VCLEAAGVFQRDFFRLIEKRMGLWNIRGIFALSDLGDGDYCSPT